MISPRKLKENTDEKNAETSLQTLVEKRWIQSEEVRVKENLKWCIIEFGDSFKGFKRVSRYFLAIGQVGIQLPLNG